MKNKLQNVDFKNVEEFLDFLPENELEVVEFLRQLIFECLPDCTEKLAYNVPYYYRHSRICFLWPASVPWGNVKQRGAVRMGFAKGHLIQDESGYFQKGDRKQVSWRDFTSPQEVDVDLLKTYIFEAAAIDENTKSKKRIILK